MTIYSMFVPGEPATAGSKTYSWNKGGKPVIYDTCKRKPVWTSIIQQAAIASKKMGSPIAGPIVANVIFYMPRPGYHYSSDGTIKTAYRSASHTKKPDATKLWRCAEDALKNFWWLDDSQIYKQTVIKKYVDPGENIGMLIEIEAS